MALKQQLTTEMQNLRGELASVSSASVLDATLSTKPGHHAVGFFNELMLRATSFLVSERVHYDDLLFTLITVPVCDEDLLMMINFIYL